MLVGLVLIIGGTISSGLLDKPKLKNASDFPKESLVSQINQPSLIKVDVSGGVVNPEVYELPIGSRIEDAIKAAGGLNEDSDVEYVSKYLNLSQKLSDGQKLYIPFKGEKVPPTVVLGTSSDQSLSLNQLVGINSASQQDLESLPSVGPVTAKKIISGRPYGDLSELTSKKIISQSVFNKINDQIDLH